MKIFNLNDKLETKYELTIKLILLKKILTANEGYDLNNR